MPGKTEQNDLLLMLKSRIPVILIETHEEQRALALLKQLAIAINRPLFSWDALDGLVRSDLSLENDGLKNTQSPTGCLRHISTMQRSALFALCDFHPYLDDQPQHVRLLKEIAMASAARRQTIILISHELKVPNELRKLVARFEMALPNAQQLEDLIRTEAAQWSQENGNRKVHTDQRTLQTLIRNLTGLTFADAQQVIRNLIYDDGAISSDEMTEVNKAKYALLDNQSALHFEYETADFAEVGGLEKLKNWLVKRSPFFLGSDTETEALALLDRPKGMLLVGVQGAGKSLAAKAVAGMWSLPLLRLDFGALYNKYHGETEKNLREVLKVAKLMAPCVLWMDEIEKGLATGDGDNGTSRRVLGSLLTFMAENRSPVFIVATSNDISQMPPELFRKGRLDEIFFIDLPQQPSREAIFRIHLNKRGQNLEHFDLPRLAEASEGFTGAEIEQVVVAGLYRSYSEKAELDTHALLEEITETNPLSVVMAEDIGALRSWAQNRTVIVD